MKVAVLVHGFADFSGWLTTDRLRPYLQEAGWYVHEHDYGFVLLPELFHNKQEARKLAEFLQHPLVVSDFVGIGHSNGCRVLQLACQMGAPFSRLALIHPALDRRAEFRGPKLRRVDVWHSSADWVVKLARFLPFHPWGDMGAVGYQGDDPKVRNHYRFKESHWAMFGRRLKEFGPELVKTLQE